MSQFGIVQYTYYCKSCFKNHKYILSFEEWQKGKFACPKCHKELKYLSCNDIRQTGNNINYKSFEKQSNENAKALGKDAIEQMENADPIINHRKQSSKKENIPWWRTHKNPEKPLNLSDIKDTEKYIVTGEKC